MSSKRSQVDGAAVWFPSSDAPDVISMRYMRRGHALEIWAIVGGHMTKTFRIPFDELLQALNVPSADEGD